MTSIRSLLVLLAIALAGAAEAQQRDIFADPKNLKVLPEDTSSADLGATMRSFALGLGIRCESCHVGEPGQPLHEFDFASDEKPMKEKARLMMKMVNQINRQHVTLLDDIDPMPRVEVRCVTCHRGRPQPKLIQDVLDEKLAGGNIEAMVAEYEELRRQYFGTHSFDFSEQSLPMYARELAGRGEIDAAFAIVSVNVEYFPDSYVAHVALAEGHAMTGDKAAAIESYQKAMALNPRAAPFLEPRIAALQAE